MLGRGCSASSKRRWRRRHVCRHLSVYRLFLALLVALSAPGGAWAQGSGGEAPRRIALLAEVTGVIGPAAAHYVQSAVDEARERQAEVLILRLDTPGGLLSSTREIVNPFWHPLSP